MGNRLEELAQKVGVDLSDENNAANKNDRFIGKRRRDWLVDSEPNENKNEKNIKSKTKKTTKGKKKPKVIVNPDRVVDLKLKNLRGNPLKLIKLLYEEASKETLTTGKLTQLEIASNLTLSRESARTALRFLLKNLFIVRVELKVGRSGWSIYKIDKDIYKEISGTKSQ